jgi:hypothetical protein
MKIKYEPFEEIVIKEYVRFDKADDLTYAFAQLRALGQPVSLNWAEGVVFIHTILPPTQDQVVDQYLKGRIYFAGISFALMDKYQNSVVYKSPQGEVAVPVINVSSNAILCEVAKWLKEQPKGK